MSASLTIKVPSISGLSLSPSEVGGGATSTGTVTLNGPSPTAGIKVTLASSKSQAKLPKSIIVPAGSKSVAFTITTSAVNAQLSTKITASQGATSYSAILTIDPIALTSLTLNPARVVGGATSTGTVNLNGPAPALGVTVALTSSQASATVLGSVYIGRGESSATFTISTSSVAAQVSATISAGTLNSSTSAVLTINPPTLTSVTLSESSVVGGASLYGTITISSPAPYGGLTIGLVSSNAAASVPSTVSVSSGTVSATFNVATQAVGSATQLTLAATSASVTIIATLTLEPPALTGITLNPTSVTSGSSSTGSVTISSAAPSSGFKISLSSNQASATAPASVSIPGGSTSATFTVATTPVAAQTVAVITAMDPNEVAFTAQLTLNPQLVQILPLSVNDMAYDSISGNIWVAAQSTDPNYPNSIVAVNPTSGAIGTVINMGVQLGHIRVTDDGQYAYVDCPQDGSVRRANLAAGTVDAIFPINVEGVYDLETLPGLPHWYAIVTDPTYGANTHVWQDGTEHPGIGTGGYDIRFLNSTQWYGDSHGQAFFDTIESNGIDWTDTIPFDCSGFILSNGLMYTAVPNIVDPVQKIVIESLPTTDFLSDREVGVSTSDNRIYYVTWDSAHNKRILSFDLATYNEHPWFDTGSIPGGCNDFMACGNHTVAFHIFGSGVTQNLVIVHGLQ